MLRLQRGRTALVAGALSVGLLAACSSSGSSTGTTGTTAAGGTATTAAPKAGGTLTMGLEAEVDGFDPQSSRWDVSGLTYANTVYDPLTKVGEDGKAHPYLAEPGSTAWRSVVVD